MWTDNETDIDLLGYTVHKDLIKSVVLDDSILPVSIGVFGDWGSGKSSIMKMLQKDFDEEDNVACVYFNGWVFEGYDDVKSALIEYICPNNSKVNNCKKFVCSKQKLQSYYHTITNGLNIQNISVIMWCDSN